ncbi:MAG TPA: hypothetical protein VIY27_09160, partial [Myxococcota bacterium]
MSQSPTPQAPAPRRAASQRFARWVTDHRFPVALALGVSTLFFLYPILNTIAAASGHPLPGPLVRIDTNARDLFPDHPYIHAQDKFAGTFGSSSLVVVAVTVDEGTIFTPEIIGAIRDITRELDGVGYDSRSDERDALRDALERDPALGVEETREILDRRYPPYPVNHDRVSSLTHNSTRIIQIQPDGTIEQDVLVKRTPRTQAEADALRKVVRQNPPFIFGRLVSRDERGALITADFATERLSSREVYTAVFGHVQEIKKKWEQAIP